MGLFASFRTLLEDHPVKWKKLFQKRSYSVFRSFLRFPVKWSLHKQWHLLFQHVLHILSASSSNRSSTKKTLTFARLHRGKVEKPHSFWSFKKHPKNIHRTAAFFRCFLAVFWEEYILGPRSRLSFRIPLYFKSHASWGISEILIHQNQIWVNYIPNYFTKLPKSQQRFLQTKNVKGRGRDKEDPVCNNASQSKMARLIRKQVETIAKRKTHNKKIGIINYTTTTTTASLLHLWLPAGPPLAGKKASPIPPSKTWWEVLEYGCMMAYSYTNEHYFQLLAPPAIGNQGYHWSWEGPPASPWSLPCCWSRYPTRKTDGVNPTVILRA